MSENIGCFWCLHFKYCVRVSERDKELVQKDERLQSIWGSRCIQFIPKKLPKEKVDFT